MKKIKESLQKKPRNKSFRGMGITKNISDTSSFIQTVLLVPDSHRISRRIASAGRGLKDDLLPPVGNYTQP